VRESVSPGSNFPDRNSVGANGIRPAIRVALFAAVIVAGLPLFGSILPPQYEFDSNEIALTPNPSPWGEGPNIGSLPSLGEDVPRGAIAAEWEDIQQRERLRIAVKDNLRPLAFRDELGNLQGFEIDIARRLAAELLGDSEAIEFVPVSNRDRLPAVYDDRADITIARVTRTEVRSRLVEFSPPYYFDGTTFVTADDSIETHRDLENRTIAVLDGSSTIAVVRYHAPEARLVGVSSYQEALAILEAGGADAFAADASVLSGWVQEYPAYRLLPVALSVEPLGIVLPKGRQYRLLRDRVSEAIVRWQAEGWLEERAAYWGLPLSEN